MNATDWAEQFACLDRAAVHVRAAQVAADRAGMLAYNGDTQAAVHYAGDAKEAATRALSMLCDTLGATMPLVQASDTTPMQSGGLDLSSLATLDTHESRELLAALEMVQSFAEKVDYQRGDILPDRIKSALRASRGTNYAEDISNLATRLRREIFGTTGTGRE